MGMRVFFAFSFDEPLQLQTSGWEQGPIYVLWRAIHGYDIYTDRFSIPFNKSIYNWLFFEVYGAIVKGVMNVLSLGDPWIPTIARFLTLFGVLLGVFVAYRSFIVALDIRDRDFKLLSLAFAVFVMTGPLIGFSAFTVRPDTWAMLFEIAAVWLFWSSWRRFGGLPASTVIGIASLVIIAWSFKQMYVFALGGIGLFLLLKRQFQSLIILAAMNIFYWAVIFFLGGPLYIQNILLLDYPMTYTLGHAWDVFINFATKSSPGLAGVAVLVGIGAAIPRIRRTLLKNDPLLFSLAGLLVSVVLVFSLSLQDGSSEIYYFSLSYFLALVALAGFHAVLDDDRASKWFCATLNAGWLTLIIAISVVFTGYRGIISVYPTHQKFTKNKQCVNQLNLPKPLFVQHDFLSLPWMVEGAEPFVLSFVYYRERILRGHQFESGGIGGLIKKRHFASIVLMGESLPEKVDGEALDGYTPYKKTCPGILVLSRNAAEILR